MEAKQTPLIDLRAALAQQAEPTVTEDMKSAVRWAPSSAYWSERLREFFGPDAREGIDALERRLAKAQQAEPLNLRDPAVQKRLATQWGYVPAAQAEPVEPVAWYRPSIAPDYYAPVFVEGAQPPAPLTQAEARLLGWRPLVPPQQAEPVGQLAELQAMLRAEVDRLIAAGIQPQRKPLTEEEIEACRQQGYAHAGLSAPFDFGKAARAVERAHGIKE